MGLRRHLRSGAAAALAGTATVLTTAAGVAETIARELRLTLPSPPEEHDTDAGSDQDTEGRRQSAGGLSDITAGGWGAPAEPDPAAPVESLQPDRTATAPWGDAPTVPGFVAPEPSVGTGADTGRGPFTGAETEEEGDAPPPWVDDVASSVAEGTVAQALTRLPDLSAPQLRAVERYERSHLSRVTLLRAIDEELGQRE